MCVCAHSRAIDSRITHVYACVCVWHDWLIRDVTDVKVTWLIYMWLYSFQYNIGLYVTWRIQMQYDWFIYDFTFDSIVTWFICMWLYAFKCNMIDLFVTWLILMWCDLIYMWPYLRFNCNTIYLYVTLLIQMQHDLNCSWLDSF